MRPSRKFYPSPNPHFSPYRLRIGRSRIDRFGVFAAESIPRGRKVIEYTGQRLSMLEVWARFRAGLPKRVYMFRLNRYWAVDGAVGGCGAERINHGCNPNLAVRRIRGHILLFSRRPIRKGEELTFDYKIHPKAGRTLCRCGSANCRGTINRN